MNAIEGIHCQDVDDLILKNVGGIVQNEPSFACTDVRRLNVSDMTLTSSGRGGSA
jgi:hypothetical protein